MAPKRFLMLPLWLALISSTARADDTDWRRFNEAGWLALQEGRIKDARERLDVALKEAEELGKSDPRLGLTLSQMAWLALKEKNRAEAEQLAGRALTVFGDATDKNTAEEARALNLLGILCRETKKNADAEGLFKRALAIEEKRNGSDDPIVAQVVTNLGALYESQGRYAEAETAFRRALAIREKTAGSKSAEVAHSLNQLGCLLHERGRLADAEQLLKKALDVRKELPRTDANEADLVLSQNNLATLYADRGFYPKAEKLYKDALDSRERKLGKDDIKVAAILYNLAKVCKDEDKGGRAREYATRALDIRDKQAPGSIELAASLEQVARIDAAKKYSAVDLLKRALDIREKVEGKDHRDVGVTAYRLANAYRDLGKHSDLAESRYKQGLALAEKYYGSKHANVAALLDDYATLIEQQIKGRAGEAQQFRDRAEKIRASAPKKSP